MYTDIFAALPRDHRRVPSNHSSGLRTFFSGAGVRRHICGAAARQPPRAGKPRDASHHPLVQVYADIFAALPRDSRRVPASRVTPLTTDDAAAFQLVENDFTVAGRKIAGNAQTITKGRWLQHTSFLWDFKSERMALLKEPARRPEYRGEREHGSFLTPIVSLGVERAAFVDGVQDSMLARGFDIQPAGAVSLGLGLRRVAVSTFSLHGIWTCLASSVQNKPAVSICRAGRGGASLLCVRNTVTSKARLQTWQRWNRCSKQGTTSPPR